MLKPRICNDCFEQCFTLFHTVLEKEKMKTQIRPHAKIVWHLISENKLLPRCQTQTESDRILTKPRGKWSRWRFRNNGSTFDARSADLPRPPFWKENRTQPMLENHQDNQENANYFSTYTKFSYTKHNQVQYPNLKVHIVQLEIRKERQRLPIILKYRGATTESNLSHDVFVF